MLKFVFRKIIEVCLIFRDEVKAMIKENRQKKGSRTLEEYESKLNKVNYSTCVF